MVLVCKRLYWKELQCHIEFIFSEKRMNTSLSNTGSFSFLIFDIRSFLTARFCKHLNQYWAFKIPALEAED